MGEGYDDSEQILTQSENLAKNNPRAHQRGALLEGNRSVDVDVMAGEKCPSTQKCG